MAQQVACYRCGETYPLGECQRCRCGEPVWLRSDPAEFDWDTGANRQGLWRYRELLPVETPVGVAGGAGGTPLLRTPRLDEYTGVQTYLKDESQNPTGSFKDRGSAVGVTHAVRDGTTAVGTVSHGNMAMSTAAHAAGADVDCVVLVPDDIPAARLQYIDQYDPIVLRIDGDYGRLYYEALEAGRGLAVSFVNSDSPLRVAGQKTIAFEILERFAPDVPDAIVLPVSSGGHGSAVWKAIRELDVAGLLPSTPRLFLVQAAACAPIATAFESGAEEVSGTRAGDTIAYSIANADPPSGTRALAAARATDGAVIAVSDDEIRDARSAFAAQGGACVEAASATSLAGVKRLSRAGYLDGDAEVVVVATGTGFKETTDMTPPDEPPTVPLTELESQLADRVH
jgi:threonine synthase